MHRKLSINLSIYQSIYLSQSISISASLSLSLSLSASLSLCLSLPLSFFYRKLETKKQLVLTASDQEFFDVLRMRRCLYVVEVNQSFYFHFIHFINFNSNSVLQIQIIFYFPDLVLDQS